MHDSDVMRFFAFTVFGLQQQVKSGGANGWRVEGDGVEVVAGCRLQRARMPFQRCWRVPIRWRFLSVEAVRRHPFGALIIWFVAIVAPNLIVPPDLSLC